MDEYLETLSAQIRNRKARELVNREIRDHLEDQIQAYREEGMDLEEAENQAVLQMGDPVAVGSDMDRIHRPKMNWATIFAIVVLSIAGLWLQYQCIYRFSGKMESSFYSMELFSRQCRDTIMGLVIMVAICFLDYTRILKWAKPAGVLFLGFFVLYCDSGTAVMMNGGYSYIKCLLYLFIPVYAGILYSYRGRGWTGTGKSVLWLAAAVWTGLRVLRGGVSVTCDMALVCAVLFLYTIGKDWYGIGKRNGIFVYGVLSPVLLLILAGFRLRNAQAYVQDRLNHLLAAVLRPELHATESGWLNLTLRRIVSGLTLGGMSADTLDGMSLQELSGISSFALPDLPYDFTLLHIANVRGIVTAGLLVLFLAGLCGYLFYVAARQKNQLGRLVGIGCVSVLALEICRSMLNNLGFYMIATGGIPFLTYGRCHGFAVYVLLGLLLGIYRYENLVGADSMKVQREQA